MRFIRFASLSVVFLYVLAAVTSVFAAESSKPRKAKITAAIVSRDGNTVAVTDKKDGSNKTVNINDQTEITRGGKSMDVTALVPGLKIKVQGTLNGEDQIEAKKVSLHPDSFDITVAQEQQILANKAAAEHAQTTADQGVANSSTAQSSADQAQSTADQGVATAQAASAVAAADAAGVLREGKRISEVADYATVASTEVYFANNSSRLTKAAKTALDQLVSANSNVNGYRVEIAGYTSKPGSEGYNQSLSERRAKAVTQYLREKADVPSWRILLPAGYGETHPAAENDNGEDRALNRRVEVKILVSKALLQQDSTVATAQP